MPCLPFNLERHPLYRATYIAYGSDGMAWRITRTAARNWRAVRNNTFETLVAPTLKDIAKRVETYNTRR